jgi:hypothetical protein
MIDHPPDLPLTRLPEDAREADEKKEYIYCKKIIPMIRN